MWTIAISGVACCELSCGQRGKSKSGGRKRNEWQAAREAPVLHQSPGHAGPLLDVRVCFVRRGVGRQSRIVWDEWGFFSPLAKGQGALRGDLQQARSHVGGSGIGVPG